MSLAAMQPPGLDGRYEIAELPAGRYSIRVTRSDLPLQYGQRRPLEPGKPIPRAVDSICDFGSVRL
jgi:hypothetical protein